jgi:CUG-BP- and ETR3-like factor
VQIPPAMTEDALRELFAPYGNVVEVHVLKKNVGSGCGFVTYDSWAACEAAITGLAGKTKLEGAKMPMVVKFADAKVASFVRPYGCGRGVGGHVIVSEESAIQ